MYPVIICEDNLIHLQQFSTIIENYILFHEGEFELVLKTQSPVELLEYLNKFNPKKGVYFLDIDLGDTLSGIDIAEKIRSFDAQSKLIFISTHDELAPLTLKRKLEALAFIVKDQSLESLRNEIIDSLILSKERLVEVQMAKKQCVGFSIGSRTHNVDMDDVLFFETSCIPHCLILHTIYGQYEFYAKISSFENTYNNLFRSSKSSLINPINVKEIDFSNRVIYFENELSCRFSIGKAKKLKNIMEKHKN